MCVFSFFFFSKGRNESDTNFSSDETIQKYFFIVFLSVAGFSQLPGGWGCRLPECLCNSRSDPKSTDVCVFATRLNPPVPSVPVRPPSQPIRFLPHYSECSRLVQRAYCLSFLHGGGGCFLFPASTELFGSSSASTSSFCEVPDWLGKFRMLMLKATSSAPNLFLLSAWLAWCDLQEGVLGPLGPYWALVEVPG